MKKWILIGGGLSALLIFGAILGGGEPPTDEPAERLGSVRVSRADFGDEWPLTVEEGILACDADAVTFIANGVVYAVNGTAETRGGGVDIDPIWADNPHYPSSGGPKKMMVLIDRGLELCS